MIYSLPNSDEPLDQCDVLDGCPIVTVADQAPDRLDQARLDIRRGIILTQTCDIANEKIEFLVVATVYDAQALIDSKIVRASDVKGPIRAGRVWGLYFLPAHAATGIAEMIVDFRYVHSIPVKVLEGLRMAGKRRIRLLTPYREHLAKHFADTYSRIGLPQPYETI
jgi:hypothetical protein